MKFIIFLLVLANLLFYAFAAGLFGHAGNPDAARLVQQVAPETIRLVSRGEPSTAAAPEASPAPVPAPANDDVLATAVASADKVCLHWDAMQEQDANRLAMALEGKVEGFSLESREASADSTGWWVFIPPLPDKAAADKKAAELRQLGISDYFVIQEAGPNRLAVSLGVFSSEKSAQDRLAELKAKGIRSVRLTVRPGKEARVSLEARGPAAGRDALLALAAKALPKARAKDCP